MGEPATPPTINPGGHTLSTNYERTRPCLFNMKVTRGWRDDLYEHCQRLGTTMSAYLKSLVDADMKLPEEVTGGDEPDSS